MDARRNAKVAIIGPGRIGQAMGKLEGLRRITNRQG